MMLEVFTVYDSAVNAYLPPFYVRSKGEAVRSFTEACNDPKSNFAKHAADFTLMYLGNYDDSGALFSCAVPVRVLSATECILDPFMPGEEADLSKVNGAKRLPM